MDNQFGNIFPSQLKILLDQVEEAVGDFDECIKLRPDSALAQAQKCFALVSTRSGYCLHIKSCALALFVVTFECDDEWYHDK